MADPKYTYIPTNSCSPEKRYKESEVIAILEDMRDWISPDDYEEGEQWMTRAALHGITLRSQRDK